MIDSEPNSNTSVELHLSQKDKERLGQIFHSGNILVHSVNTDTLHSILESGVITPASEADPKYLADKADQIGAGEELKSRGGNIGISFNYNHIDVLVGDPSSLFITSPEALFEANQHIKLAPRKDNSPNELQALPETFSPEDEIGGTLEYRLSTLEKMFHDTLPRLPLNKCILIIHESQFVTVNSYINNAKEDQKPHLVLIYTGEPLHESFIEANIPALHAGNALLETLYKNIQSNHPIPYSEIVPNANYQEQCFLTSESLKDAMEIRPDGKGGIQLMPQGMNIARSTNEDLFIHHETN